MRVISLFSGTGAFELGFERNGFRVVGQCEFDQHAQAVLRRHWPDVPLHADIKMLEGDAFGPAEVVVWGSPCQGLSLAGRRAGLEDERSGLFTEGIRFIRELRHATDDQYPHFSVWENVPGALSSAAGRDFRAVLEAFLEAEVPMPRSGKWANAGVVRGNGREVAWRVLDSQHFGVAQRRRRVFVVTDFGGHGAAEVLFEREGVPGHPPQGRAPGEGITGALTGGAGSSSAGNPDDNRAQAGFLIPEVMPTMRAGGGNDTPSKGQVSGDTRDEYIVPVAIAPTGTHPTLNAAHGGKDAGPAGLVPVAFALRGREDGAMPEVSGDKASALRGAAGGSSRDMVAYAATDYSTGSFTETGVSGPLTGTLDRSRAAMLVNPVTYGVRRLIPLECERLQGLPDDWTELGHYYEGFDRERLWNAKTRTRPKGEEAEAIVRKIADTHRYRLCGNAVTVNVAEWLGGRVAAALAAKELEDAA